MNNLGNLCFYRYGTTDSLPSNGMKKRLRSEAEPEGNVNALTAPPHHLGFCVYLSAQPSTTASVANIVVTAITTKIVSRVIILLHDLARVRWRTRHRIALDQIARFCLFTPCCETLGRREAYMLIG